MTEDNKVIQEDANTQVTGEPEAKVEAEVKVVEKEPSQESIDNAVYAALRKKDVDTAKKLLEGDKPKEVDLSGYVEKDKFDELLNRFGELNEAYSTSTHNSERDSILRKHNLSEEDASLIMTDDLKELEERAIKLSGRNSVSNRQAAVSTKVPEDLQSSELAKRLL